MAAQASKNKVLRTNVKPKQQLSVFKICTAVTISSFIFIALIQSSSAQQDNHIKESFKNAGKNPGLEIWRIEDFRPVPCSPKDYGKFYSGNAYIVLSTKKVKENLIWDLHLWLGSQVLRNEANIAAKLTDQLYDLLNGRPIKRPEIQDNESLLFMYYFKKGVRYLDGGVGSAFKNIQTNATNEYRLFEIQYKANVRARQIGLLSTLNAESNCFILDTGKQLNVYLGPKAEHVEKLKSVNAAKQIKEQDYNGKIYLHILDNVQFSNGVSKPRIPTNDQNVMHKTEFEIASIETSSDDKRLQIQPRFWSAIWKGIKTVGKVVGGIIGITDMIKPDKKQSQNSMDVKEHREALQNIVNRIENNYQGIENVKNAVERNSKAIETISENVLKLGTMLEKTEQSINKNINSLGIQMEENFKKLESQIEKLKEELASDFEKLQAGDKISKLITFMNDFSNKKSFLEDYSTDLRVTELTRSNGILDMLKNAINPDGILHSNLYHILNEDLAIPKNNDDRIAFAAFDILYFGIQNYVSTMFFVLEQYTFLADFHFQKTNTEKYNECLALLQLSFNDFKMNLLGKKEENSLILKIAGLTEKVKNMYFIDNNYKNVLEIRIKQLKESYEKLVKFQLPIIPEKPESIVRKPDFTQSNVTTPIVDWIPGKQVSYAVQYTDDASFSKLGDWSKPFLIGGKSNPLVRIPVDANGRKRLIYRKIDNEKPELVGILKDKYEENFRDIDQDLYKIASKFQDEDISIREGSILLKNGANLTATFQNGRSIIHAAAEGGNIEFARRFLFNKSIFDIDMKDNDGYTALHLAAGVDNEEFVKHLIDNGADINARTKDNNMTSLLIAVYKGFYSSVSTLIENPHVDINAKTTNDLTALHFAVSNIPILNVLLSKDGIDINAKTDADFTPLHLSVINNHLDATELLLKQNGVKHNAKATGNFTALHFAGINGNNEMKELLLSNKKIDINAQAVSGWTPLHLVFLNNFVEDSRKFDLIKTLIENGANINAKDSTGKSPLHLAAEKSNLEMIKFLIDNRANINSFTEISQVPLQFAAEGKNLPVMDYLINGKGVYVNIEDRLGRTPLHIACENGDIEMVKFLDKAGADFNLDDYENRNSLHHAARSGDINLVKYIVEKNVNLTVITDLYEMTPIHEAAVIGKIDIVKFLMEKIGNKFPQSEYFVSLLHMAVSSRSLDLVTYLVNDIKLSVYIPDEHNRTPFDVAIVNNDTALINYFDTNWKNSSNFFKKNYDQNLENYFANPFLENSFRTILVENFENKAKFMENYEAYIQTNLQRDNGTIKDRIPHIKNYLVTCVTNTLGKYLTSEMSNVTNQFNEKFPINAIASNNLQIIKDIFKNNANLTNELYFKINLLDAAVFFKNLNIVKYLFEETDFKKYKEVLTEKTSLKNAFNNTGLFFPTLSSIHIASLRGEIDILKYLIEKLGVFVDIEGVDSTTPLLHAKDISTIKFLAKQNANIMAHNENGDTLLHLTVNNNGNLQLIKSIIEEGSSLRARNKKGETPINLYKSKNIKTAIIKLNENDPANKFIDEVDLGKTILMSNGELGVTISRNNCNKNVNCLKKMILDTITYTANNAGTASDINLNPDYIKQLLKKEVSNNVGLNNLHLAVIKNDTNTVQSILKQNNIDINARTPSKFTAFHLATMLGNLNTVKLLINKKIDINAKAISGWTAIHLATGLGRDDILATLVENGAQIDIKNEMGETSLHIAIRNNLISNKIKLILIKYLIEKGADVNAKDIDGLSPLHEAVKADNLEIVKYLINNRANINGFNNDGETPLHIAAKDKHFSIVNYLLTEKDLYVDVEDRLGKTPLHKAIENGHSDMMTILESKGANIKLNDFEGRTALHYAIKSANMGLIQKIHESFNESVNIKDIYDITPLHAAAEKGNLEAVKFLIKNQSNIDANKAEYSETLLHLVAGSGNLDLTKYLVEEIKMNINSLDIFERLPLEYAIDNGHFNIAKYFTENTNLNSSLYSQTIVFEAINTDLNSDKLLPIDKLLKFSKYKVFRTLFQKAVKTNKNQIIEFLENENFDLKQIGYFNRTLLHYAVAWNSIDLVEYLIKINNDCITMKDENNETPLDLASKSNNPNIIKLLLKQYPNLETNVNLFELLKNAIENDQLEIVKYFVEEKKVIVDKNSKELPMHHAAAHSLNIVKYFVEEHNIFVELANKNNQTPLVIAASNNRNDIFEYLVNRNANVMARDSSGKTALHYAVENGNFDLFEFLIKNGASLRAKNNDNKIPIDLAHSFDILVKDINIENRLTGDFRYPGKIRYQVTGKFWLEINKKNYLDA